MIEVAGDGEYRDHSEQEATCPKEMLRHHRSGLPSGVWVKSNGRSSDGERERSRGRQNGRHDRSMANELGDRRRREGHFYSPRMLASI